MRKRTYLYEWCLWGEQSINLPHTNSKVVSVTKFLVIAILHTKTTDDVEVKMTDSEVQSPCAAIM